MKPTTRTSTQRRLEALETRQSDKTRTPELRLILDKGDGTKEVHILGKGGTFIVPAKIEPQQWMEKARALPSARTAT